MNYLVLVLAMLLVTVERVAVAGPAEPAAQVKILPAFGDVRRPFTGTIVHIEPEIGFVATALTQIDQAKRDQNRQFEVTLSDGRVVMGRSFRGWDDNLKLGWITLDLQGSTQPPLRETDVPPLIMMAPAAERNFIRDKRAILVKGHDGTLRSATIAQCEACSPSFFGLVGQQLIAGDAVFAGDTRKFLGLVVETTGSVARAVFATSLHQALNAKWQVPMNRLLAFRNYRAVAAPLSPEQVRGMIRLNNFHNPSGRVLGPEAALLPPALGAPDFAKRFQEFDERFYLGLRSEVVTKAIVGLDVPSRGANWHRYSIDESQELRRITDEASGLQWLVWSRPMAVVCSGEFNGYMQFSILRSCVGQLNAKAFGGFSDWRIPTVEELMSLMELDAAPVVGRDEKFHVDPRFEPQGGCYWTADSVAEAVSDWLWTVCFHAAANQLGLALPGPKAMHAMNNQARLLAVRTIQP